ncbi:hypothetical protein [Novosphingobium sp. Gsoil 351]|uniref:hypothetical protein n=1 Tax=Novosphingobium sp. Gsoil 351 TaxID=2675225 RepID=UPI0012B49AB7|nr:hypothetical protein [Novosphingobium sp. Gsoil 351]QGN53270.1 hypothetical protein GKE62_00560 [Novosphingobium sp. Gsoil 351]
MHQPFLKAWLLCGTLDALYASILSLARGGGVGDVWRGVASGPFGAAAQSWSIAGVFAGVAVHFAIMAAMTAVAAVLFRRSPLGDANPWLAGTLYGLALYGVMYGIVLPARFGAPFPNPDRIKLALGLFPHVAFVGIPMALLLGRPKESS